MQLGSSELLVFQADAKCRKRGVFVQCVSRNGTASTVHSTVHLHSRSGQLRGSHTNRAKLQCNVIK